MRENMKPARMARSTGLLGSYIHHDGSVGVLLAVEGAPADPQLLRDICMHITAKNPLAAVREDMPADRIAKEKEIAAGGGAGQEQAGEHRVEFPSRWQQRLRAVGRSEWLQASRCLRRRQSASDLGCAEENL